VIETHGHRHGRRAAAQWSPDDRQLASGGNDNAVAVWAAGGGGAGSGGAEAVFRGTAHTAAVKALAWSPHQRGLLATGGGTSDKHIRCGRAPPGPAGGGVLPARRERKSGHADTGLLHF